MIYRPEITASAFKTFPAFPLPVSQRLCRPRQACFPRRSGQQDECSRVDRANRRSSERGRHCHTVETMGFRSSGRSRVLHTETSGKSLAAPSSTSARPVALGPKPQRRRPSHACTCRNDSSRNAAARRETHSAVTPKEAAASPRNVSVHDRSS